MQKENSGRNKNTANETAVQPGRAGRDRYHKCPECRRLLLYRGECVGCGHEVEEAELVTDGGVRIVQGKHRCDICETYFDVVARLINHDCDDPPNQELAHDEPLFKSDPKSGLLTDGGEVIETEVAGKDRYEETCERCGATIEAFGRLEDELDGLDGVLAGGDTA